LRPLVLLLCGHSEHYQRGARCLPGPGPLLLLTNSEEKDSGRRILQISHSPSSCLWAELHRNHGIISLLRPRVGGQA
jgi:hypothetical protein